MKFAIFGSIGFRTGIRSNLRSTDVILTKHARERIMERTNCSNPLKELNRLLVRGVLISTKNGMLQISNGVFTLICSTDNYPHPIITFRQANERERNIFNRENTMCARAVIKDLRKREQIIERRAT